MFTACAYVGRTEEALDVFKSMQAVTAEPDVMCSSSLVTACANVGRTEEALDVFKSMQAAGL